VLWGSVAYARSLKGLGGCFLGHGKAVWAGRGCRGLGEGRLGGCEEGHRSEESSPARVLHRTWRAPMRNIIILIVATGLLLCSVDVWAGGSRTDTADNAAVFVICNAL